MLSGESSIAGVVSRSPGITPALRLGWIPYVNLWPMHVEILRQIPAALLDVRYGTPVEVFGWLQSGDVALAPSSSIRLLLHQESRPIAPVGVASRGSVGSVYLGFKAPALGWCEWLRTRNAALGAMLRPTITAATQSSVHDLCMQAADLWRVAVSSVSSAPLAEPTPRVWMTPASAASAALTKILWHLWISREPARAGNAETADAVLLIGDEALARRHEFSAIIDLGAAWEEVTGLPFVYAVWQTFGETEDTSARQSLVEAAARAQDAMWSDAAAMLPALREQWSGQAVWATISDSEIETYWRNIYYVLGDADRRSLGWYYMWYAKASGIPESRVRETLGNVDAVFSRPRGPRT